MTRLQWNAAGYNKFQAGVERGVLYVRDSSGNYGDGVPWSGLTTVTESPSGAEPNKQYADNKVYVILKSAEEFAATIEAFWSPKEFDQCDGSATPVAGLHLGQQARKSFGFSWVSLLGDELVGTDLGRRMHFAYGCNAAPSERANATLNESPEAGGLSWEVSTNPVDVGTINGVAYRPVAHVYVDSTEVSAATWQALEDIAYGSASGEPRLPMPQELFDLINGAVTVVNLGLAANQPSFVSSTGVITLPAVTGVQWKINGVNKSPGAQPAIATGATATVLATPLAGYSLGGDDDWVFSRP